MFRGVHGIWDFGSFFYWAVEMGTYRQQLVCLPLLFSVRVPKVEDLELQLSLCLLLVPPQLPL